MKHKNASLRLAPALDEKMENFTACWDSKNFFYYKKQKKRNLVELFVDSAEGYCRLNMAVNVRAAHKRRISLSNEKPRWVEKMFIPLKDTISTLCADFDSFSFNHLPLSNLRHHHHHHIEDDVKLLNKLNNSHKISQRWWIVLRDFANISTYIVES